MRRTLYISVLALALGFAGFQALRWAAAGRCQDRGGRWDAQSGQCLCLGTAQFPGPVALASNDQAYRLVSAEAAADRDSGLKFGHELSLVEARSGRMIRRYPYSRYVTAMWAPDNRHVALTDHAGSNVSFVILWTINNGEVVETDLSAQVAPACKVAAGKRWDVLHEYPEAVAWLPGRRLQVAIKGDYVPQGAEGPARSYAGNGVIILE